MTVQVPTRLDDAEVQHIDELVQAGLGPTRSHVIRIALHELYDRHRRAEIAAKIVASYTERPQSAQDDEWAADSLDDWLGPPDAPR
jgi:Arc/MetJ-type ribon-helix-helix transcriptional regulator